MLWRHHKNKSSCLDADLTRYIRDNCGLFIFWNTARLLTNQKFYTYNAWHISKTTVEVWDYFHTTAYNEFNYLSMLGFKLIHIRKRGTLKQQNLYIFAFIYCVDNKTATGPVSTSLAQPRWGYMVSMEYGNEQHIPSFTNTVISLLC